MHRTFALQRLTLLLDVIYEDFAHDNEVCRAVAADTMAMQPEDLERMIHSALVDEHRQNIAIPEAEQLMHTTPQVISLEIGLRLSKIRYELLESPDKVLTSMDDLQALAAFLSDADAVRLSPDADAPRTVHEANAELMAKARLMGSSLSELLDGMHVHHDIVSTSPSPLESVGDSANAAKEKGRKRQIRITTKNFSQLLGWIRKAAWLWFEVASLYGTPRCTLPRLDAFKVPSINAASFDSGLSEALGRFATSHEPKKSVAATEASVTRPTPTRGKREREPADHDVPPRRIITDCPQTASSQSDPIGAVNTIKPPAVPLDVYLQEVLSTPLSKPPLPTFSLHEESSGDEMSGGDFSTATVGGAAEPCPPGGSRRRLLPQRDSLETRCLFDGSPRATSVSSLIQLSATADGAPAQDDAPSKSGTGGGATPASAGHAAAMLSPMTASLFSLVPHGSRSYFLCDAESCYLPVPLRGFYDM